MDYYQQQYLGFLYVNKIKILIINPNFLSHVDRLLNSSRTWGEHKINLRLWAFGRQNNRLTKMWLVWSFLSVIPLFITQ